MNYENQNFNQIPVPPNNGFPNQNPIPPQGSMPVDSLGTVGVQATPSMNVDSLNTPVPEPVPNTNPVNLNPPGMIPNITPTEPNINQPVEPLMGTNLGPNSNVNLNQNSMNMNMNSNPYQNNMMMGGELPPINNQNMLGGVPVPPITPNEPPKSKKKSKLNKTAIIIIVVVLILAVGAGVYFFLNMSKKQAVTITPKLGDTWELGEPIVNNVLSYVTLSGITASQCTLKSNIDVTKTGTYEWSVTCGSKTTGNKTISVKDQKPPVVITKDVTVVPNTEITADDFIESATDASSNEGKITANFKDKSEFDITKEGTYEVTIEVADTYQNTATVTANLIVSNNAPVRNLVCTYEEISKTYPKATVNVRFRYGITTSNTVYDNAKIIDYVFDEDTYDDALADVTEKGFDGLEGKVITDDDKYTITVEVSLTKEDLSTEFAGASFPDTQEEIEKLHTDRGDYCYIEE